MAQAALLIQCTDFDSSLLGLISLSLKQSISKVAASHLHTLKAVSVEDFLRQAKKIPKAADIEYAIRQQKLRDAMRMKQELEEKLSYLQSSISTIELLKSTDEEPVKKKPLLNKQTRALYYQEMQLKQHETEKLAKRHLADQHERKRRVIEQHRKQRELLLTEDHKILHKLEEERLALAEEQKQARIKAMQNKLAMRQAERERLNQIAAEELPKVKHSKPLYVQIEEAYAQRQIMPQLQRHKTELALKRIYFSPVSRQELQEHARHYEEAKAEHLQRRSLIASENTMEHLANFATKSSSKFTYAVVEQERRLKSKDHEAAEERRQLMQKQKQYASLIKEIFVPVPDSSKKAEVDRRINTHHHSTVYSRTRSPTHKVSLSDNDPNISKSTSWTPHKFKPNPMITVSQPKREAIKVDFLADRRRDRETSGDDLTRSIKSFDLNAELESTDLTERASAARLLAKAKKIERAARRQELTLTTGLKSNAQVDVIESVNDALVTSVKAKLALLDSVMRR